MYYAENGTLGPASNYNIRPFGDWYQEAGYSIKPFGDWYQEAGYSIKPFGYVKAGNGVSVRANAPSDWYAEGGYSIKPFGCPGSFSCSCPGSVERIAPMGASEILPIAQTGLAVGGAAAGSVFGGPAGGAIGGAAGSILGSVLGSLFGGSSAPKNINGLNPTEYAQEQQVLSQATSANQQIYQAVSQWCSQLTALKQAGQSTVSSSAQAALNWLTLMQQWVETYYATPVATADKVWLDGAVPIINSVDKSLKACLDSGVYTILHAAITKVSTYKKAQSTASGPFDWPGRFNDIQPYLAQLQAMVTNVPVTLPAGIPVTAPVTPTTTIPPTPVETAPSPTVVTGNTDPGAVVTGTVDPNTGIPYSVLNPTTTPIATVTNTPSTPAVAVTDPRNVAVFGVMAFALFMVVRENGKGKKTTAHHA